MRPSIVCGLFVAAALQACTEHGRGGGPVPPDTQITEPGPPPLDCDGTVGDQSQCPTERQVCSGGVCGAAFDCCFVRDGQWSELFVECGACPDAGIDGP